MYIYIWKDYPVYNLYGNHQPDIYIRFVYMLCLYIRCIYVCPHGPTSSTGHPFINWSKPLNMVILLGTNASDSWDINEIYELS